MATSIHWNKLSTKRFLVSNGRLEMTDVDSVGIGWKATNTASNHHNLLSGDSSELDYWYLNTHLTRS